MIDIPEVLTARRLSYNPTKHFYILSDGTYRYYCPENFFPNGCLKENVLVSFTCKPAPQGTKFPCVTSVIFAPELEKVK